MVVVVGVAGGRILMVVVDGRSLVVFVGGRNGSIYVVRVVVGGRRVRIVEVIATSETQRNASRSKSWK